MRIMSLDHSLGSCILSVENLRASVRCRIQWPCHSSFSRPAMSPWGGSCGNPSSGSHPCARISCRGLTSPPARPPPQQTHPHSPSLPLPLPPPPPPPTSSVPPPPHHLP